MNRGDGKSATAVVGLLAAAAFLGFAVGQRVALGEVKASEASLAREILGLKRAVAEVQSAPRCESEHVDVAALARACAFEAAQSRPAAPSPAPSAAPPPPHEETAENTQAAADGTALVDRALRAGTWTSNDAQQLRTLRDRMTDEQREQLVRRVIVAINAGTLTSNFRGAPL
ncbi:MAG TPA: hypothetical protein VGI39_18215 [Polyangiaceae bacterium]|jgi:hypothetical protein